MLPLRNSVSNSLKLLRKTLQTLTSLFSCSETVQYYKIPKPHPKIQNSCNPETNMSESDQASAYSYIELEKPRRFKGKTETPVHREKAREQETGERLLVTSKLKEMEMLDMSNVDHVLDIEEVLHYYSRLRSPVYLDLFHKFFMEIFSEFACPPPTSGPNRIRSRPTFQKTRH